MGPAHCTIMNHTTSKICVITFNNADIIYANYNTLYVLESGQAATVEANPDPTGLKVGIIYAVNPDKKEFLYHRFLCKNDGTLNITEVRGDDISYYGNRDDAVLQTKGKIKEKEREPFDMVKDVVYNMPSNSPNRDDRPKLPPVISNAAKTLATGIQTSINQAQTQLNNIGGQAGKALGIKSDQNTNSEHPDTQSNKNPYQYDSSNISSLSTEKQKPPEAPIPEISVADKWEQELKRLKEETRRQTLPIVPPPDPLFKPQDKSISNSNSPAVIDSPKNTTQSSSGIADGFLVPQPRTKRPYQEIPVTEPPDFRKSAVESELKVTPPTRPSPVNAPRNPFLPKPFEDESFPPLPTPPSHREESTDSEVSSRNGVKSSVVNGVDSLPKNDHLNDGINLQEHDDHVVAEAHNGCKCIIM